MRNQRNYIVSLLDRNVDSEIRPKNLLNEFTANVNAQYRSPYNMVGLGDAYPCDKLVKLAKLVTIAKDWSDQINFVIRLV